MYPWPSISSFTSFTPTIRSHFPPLYYMAPRSSVCWVFLYWRPGGAKKNPLGHLKKSINTYYLPIRSICWPSRYKEDKMEHSRLCFSEMHLYLAKHMQFFHFNRDFALTSNVNWQLRPYGPPLLVPAPRGNTP